MEESHKRERDSYHYALIPLFRGERRGARSNAQMAIYREAIAQSRGLFLLLPFATFLLPFGENGG